MKRLTLVIFLIIFFGGAGLLWWKNGNEPVNSQDRSNKIFTIEKGTPVREIGNKLKTAGFIKDPTVFFLALKKEGKDKSIQAGDYKLSPSMNLSEVIESLEHGTHDKWITFQEGLRAEEYAEILQKNFPQYDNSWIEKLKSQEGYLFPDTYLIPREATIDDIVLLLTDTFYSKVAPLGLARDSANLHDVVTSASLIEREGLSDEEKPVIAGILRNRIEEGMPLQIDATIQYAKGYNPQKKSWWPEVYLEDYKGVNSVYNTYLFQGLPPTPIASPGLVSINAALKPAKTSYFYYLHGKNGQIHYAKTSTEHERNVAKYIY